ncbi:cytochrome c oxidase assembly protein [Rhodococcus sp. NM-2]|uniref:cytochrome c oxidase assembly protein n=1 Tax=Rhodococcus sp. NM-2 TaxID=3401174 RepID=UPI003AB031DC
MTAWTVTPLATVSMVAATLAYLILVRRLARRGQRWHRGALASWLLAMMVLVIALNSGMAVYAGSLFWVHMLVHLLLIMVVPVLLVGAAPIRLLHDASSSRGRVVVDRIVTSAPSRILTTPVFTVPLYTTVIVLTHLTGFQQAMATHMWIHDTELALYLLAGYLLLLPLIGDELTARPLPHLLRWAVLALCMGPDTFVGITLMMTDYPLAPAYAGMRPDWGPTALTDQKTAGAIMWFGGDGLMMTLMVLITRQWIATGRGGLGRWLEGIRRQATLGDTERTSVDVDDDQAALDAYNARLAALHEHDRRSRRSYSVTARDESP